MNSTAEKLLTFIKESPYCVSGSGDDEEKIWGKWIYRAEGG